jgi:aspartyl-tRNA(Asn)/glutamyl-tRNA(Gln) amidotransferase subunit A
MMNKKAEISRGELDIVEETRKALDMINENNSKFNHYITITRDLAIQQAREVSERAKKGECGKLCGLLIALKDVIYLTGFKTTASSKVLENYYPSFDAKIVEILKKEGAIIVGKTNTHEFASGATNTSLAFGPTRNPSDPELITGGSSGGSAVTVALNEVPIAIGTDTGGSVRIPASFCGVMGFKPTYGKISRKGIIPLAWSFDTVGILGKEINHIREVFEVLSERDESDSVTLLPIKARKRYAKRIAVIKTEVDENVNKAFERALNKISREYKLEEIVLPHLDEIIKVRFFITNAEMASYHEEMFYKYEKLYGNDVASSIRIGLSITASDYINALRARRVILNSLMKTLKQYDFFLCPTTPILPPKISEVIGNESKYRPVLVRNTSIFNFTGNPAISIPLNNFVGLQVIGNIGDDMNLLKFSEDLLGLIK